MVRSLESKSSDRWAHLAASMRSRDAAAFRVLHDASRKFLFFYAYKIVCNHHLAEDVLQEAFSLIWLEADSYRPELGSPLTWMCAIVKNKSIDLIRKNTLLHAEQYFDDETYALKIDISSDPCEILCRKQTSVIVKKYLRDLSGAEMAALHLTYYNDMGHIELAAMLCQPVGTVKTHIRRGLIRLKRREAKIRSEV